MLLIVKGKAQWQDMFTVGTLYLGAPEWGGRGVASGVKPASKCCKPKELAPA